MILYTLGTESLQDKQITLDVQSYGISYDFNESDVFMVVENNIGSMNFYCVPLNNIGRTTVPLDFDATRGLVWATDTGLLFYVSADTVSLTELNYRTNSSVEDVVYVSPTPITYIFGDDQGYVIVSQEISNEIIFFSFRSGSIQRLARVTEIGHKNGSLGANHIFSTLTNQNITEQAHTPLFALLDTLHANTKKLEMIGAVERWSLEPFASLLGLLEGDYEPGHSIMQVKTKGVVYSPSGEIFESDFAMVRDRENSSLFFTSFPSSLQDLIGYANKDGTSLIILDIPIQPEDSN